MKHENEVRELLINNTIHLVAKGGFERATTKEVTFCGGSLPDLKMNEVYIYRLFGSKESLYEQTFLYLDKKLIAAFRKGAKFTDSFEENTKEKLYDVFATAWKFITDNEESCLFYVRYYYSPYFKGKSQEEHLKLFEEMIKRLVPIFADGADAVSILHSVFTATFDFAVRVYNGELEDSEENQDHIFNVLYCIIATYLKNSQGEKEWPLLTKQ